MNPGIFVAVGIIFAIILIVYLIAGKGGSLDNIKSRPVGDGQFGTAKWATKEELKNNLTYVPFEPEMWRKGENLPTQEGIILGAELHGKNVTAIIDTSDNHTMFVSAPGGGKTTSLLYPNIEYSAACGMSFFVTDTKGTVSQDYVPVLRDCYHMRTYVIDMRNPANSDGYNLLALTNKYIDRYKNSGNLADKGRAESYAKTVGTSVINLNDSTKQAGSNKFFYIAAEGVISAITYLVSELCEPRQRHILSVFKICRQIIEIDPSTVGKKGVVPQTYLSQLYALLPENHVAKDLLSAAATAGELKTIASIISTAVLQMLAFLDSEMEQLLCFDDGIDIEQFVEGKTAIIFIFDEASNTKNIIANLLIRQSYNELLKASEKCTNNRLPHRIEYYLDEFGTYTALDGVQQFFSAGRSRNIMTNPFLQALSQLDEKYGKETAKNIKASCQNVMLGFQSPLSDDAKTFSDSLGTQTVMSGSVSKRYGTANTQNSTTYQMIKKPLMSAEQIKNMKKGEWILTRTGMNPVKMKLPQLERWNIRIDKEHPYRIESKASRVVEYADRSSLMNAIRREYHNANLIPNINTEQSRQSVSDEYI